MLILLDIVLFQENLICVTHELFLTLSIRGLLVEGQPWVLICLFSLCSLSYILHVLLRKPTVQKVLVRALSEREFEREGEVLLLHAVQSLCYNYLH